MVDKFINRNSEIKALKSRYAVGKAEFIVIYGKRRVGKTALIKHFIEEYDSIYLLADKSNEKLQMEEFSAAVAKHFGDKFISFSRWTYFFEYLKEKAANKRIIVAIDEFPYLIDANKAIPSIFQKAWDEYFKETKIFLILCGSSISIMETEVLGYKSPLYGRRTGQLLINPLRFKDVLLFFPGVHFEEIITCYSILGGIPAYLEQFDKRDIRQNILKNILATDSFLYNEIEFVLQQELREPRQYFSILKEMSLGKTRVNEIANAIGIERNALSKYLAILEDLRIIKKEVPVFEKNMFKSRKGIYKIAESYFNFWFRFVFPNKSKIEIGEKEEVMKIINKELNVYVSHAFEDICKQFIEEWKGKPFGIELLVA